jgi:orotidine-5'-phosphate decarboxylase
MDRAPRDKLIVALDVESAERALDLFETLREVAGMFKIGSQLFTTAGPDLVRRIVALGGRVFLDLKFHDIPNTVAAAAVAAARLGVSIFNLHASGGEEMMRRAAAAVAETTDREGLDKPAVIAVTLLTSMDQDTLRPLGISSTPDSIVQNLASLSHRCGLDGVVCSPLEIAQVRAAIADPSFLIVTPGVRPDDSSVDDQRRVMTPMSAILAGADYIVVGRPILKAADPAAAARRIIEEIDQAAKSV